MTGSGLQVICRIVRANPAADLQPARPGPEGKQRLLLRGLVILASLMIQQNHMSAARAAFPVKTRIESRILLRDEVFPRLILLIPQTAAHDLLYFSIVNINAWPKFHVYVSFRSFPRSLHRKFLILTGDSRPLVHEPAWLSPSCLLLCQRAVAARCV